MNVNLTKRENQVYKLRLKGLTLRAIGEKQNCSPERIRQIESNVLRKLNRKISPRWFDVLSVRSANCLLEAGVKSIEEAQSKSDIELLMLRNFGKKSLKELRGL